MSTIQDNRKETKIIQQEETSEMPKRKPRLKRKKGFRREGAPLLLCLFFFWFGGRGLIFSTFHVTERDTV